METFWYQLTWIDWKMAVKPCLSASVGWVIVTDYGFCLHTQSCLPASVAVSHECHCIKTDLSLNSIVSLIPSVLWHGFGDRKGISSVKKILHQQSSKLFFYGKPVLSRSNLWWYDAILLRLSFNRHILSKTGWLNKNWKKNSIVPHLCTCFDELLSDCEICRCKHAAFDYCSTSALQTVASFCMTEATTSTAGS